ncbi:MAG: META domain-containing protein [Anaerolineae bacterium]|jgi:heat shock protein HslJ
MKSLKQYPIGSALLLAALIMVSGCAAPTADAPGEGNLAGHPVTALTEQAIRNATYPSEWEEGGEITLIDGRFEGEPFVEGGATRPIVTLIEPVAFGDLDGDGVDEAVVILATSPGGSGTFVSLEAMGNDNGTPVHLASYQLGDRVRAESLAIQDGQIVLEMVTHGPDDPMCCPTQIVRTTYALEDGALVEATSEVIGTVAEVEEPAPPAVPPGLVVGITWQWTELAETEPASRSLVPDPENYTLVLRSDGIYQVKADCNLSSGSYTLEGNRLTLLPGPTTLAECGPDSLYDEYLAFLGQVVTIELDGEKLILNLKEGAGKMGFVKGAAKAEVVDITWQWAELIEAEPASQSLVPDPENYTLILRSDGTYQVKADCNVGSGGYTLEGNNLTLEPGPMTLAECGPESLFDLYLTKLGNVESLSVEDGRLILHLGGNAGKVVFRNAGPAGEKDSVPAGADITGTVWMWTETTTPTGVTSVGDPEKYTIELLPDGQFRVRADCNRGSGSYRLRDSHVSFEFGPMTLAECEQGSLSDQFIKELSAAAIYFLEGEALFIDLKFDSGTMRFAPGG